MPDTPKVVDYYFRAVHDVTVAGKQMVKAFFNAPRIDRAYFDGCSNGGRMAFVQATRFPDDYDGIIAGAPFLDIRVVLGGVGKAKALLTSDSYIPFVQLPLIDQAVYTSCDAADGVSDNLIQNPAACAFDPDTLVPGTRSSRLNRASPTRKSMALTQRPGIAAFDTSAWQCYRTGRLSRSSPDITQKG